MKKIFKVAKTECISIIILAVFLIILQYLSFSKGHMTLRVLIIIAEIVNIIATILILRIGKKMKSENFNVYKATIKIAKVFVFVILVTLLSFFVV